MCVCVYVKNACDSSSTCTETLCVFLHVCEWVVIYVCEYLRTHELVMCVCVCVYVYTDEQAFAYDMCDNGDINVALLGTRVHCTTPPAENAG